MQRKIMVFDTTLRDGEQSPGASMNLKEKLAIARQLAKLNVDVIEAGFPFSSPADFDSVYAIAQEIEGPIICGLCRTKEEDIKACANAIAPASRRRVHTFIGTSELHVTKKLQKTYAEVLDMAVFGVRYARSLCEDVEFSAEDAMRTDPSYLREVVQAVIEAGASTVNIPDTVGYATPWQIEEVMTDLFENVPNVGQARISVHNHNDLGLAVANSLAAIRFGATQVECTINGIGERAGNCSLEEVVMGLRVRPDWFDGAYTDIVTEHLVRASELVSRYSSIVVQPNKAIVGSNAFKHEAGIHQHGMLADRNTYEIMTPESVGWEDTVLSLGPRSGKSGIRARLKVLGFQVDDQQLEELYRKYIQLADRKKQIYDEDLEALMLGVDAAVPHGWTIKNLQFVYGAGGVSNASVSIAHNGDELREGVATGRRCLDAVFGAIANATGVQLDLLDYGIRSISKGNDAVAEASLHLGEGTKESPGRGAAEDIILASAHAYLNAINRYLASLQVS